MDMHEKGFTLIELLIVVAIIAILAAIAVPNFLEAQIRSKVSRAKSDMRSIATALEAYFVDANHYPWPYPKGSLSASNVPNELSTPVAFISSSAGIQDPFSIQIGRRNAQYKRYGYITDERLGSAYLSGWTALLPDYKIACGKWRLDSFGPDERSGPKGGASNWPNEVTYDPTNGTISRGDIYRSQRDAEGLQVK
ncbi:MAG TPA: prepilin-type N-terminal cleavage/methylation domain-containing protein [Candidatus Sumerlaeota bacterium]|nr:prepilin-type N-terminal cleavage/methylation domain-containing protein [Candidatus Sumerlaeota bacterium]